VIQAVGRLEDHYKLYLAMSDTRLMSIEQIRATILRSGPGGLVRLGDVATVSEGTAPQWVRVTADGHDAVIFQSPSTARRQYGADRARYQNQAR